MRVVKSRINTPSNGRRLCRALAVTCTAGLLLVPKVALGQDKVDDPCARWTSATLDSAFRAVYDSESLIEVIRKRGNDAGEISWQASYVLMATAAMIRATGDAWYLTRARALAEAILASTDAARKVRDWRGTSGHGWSDTRYARDSARIRGPVGDGMVAYGLLVAAEAAREILRRERNVSQAAWWDTVAQQVHIALTEDRRVWRERDGRMTWPDSFPSVGTRNDVPINQDLIFAAAEMVLEDLTGVRGPGDDRAKARRFRSTVSLTSAGAVWPYWWPTPGPGGPDNRAEDVSHAGLDLVYAVRAYKRGWLSDTLMAAFASTFGQRFEVRRGDMAYFVHGRGQRVPAGLTGQPAIGLWLLVKRWNPSIRRTFCGWIDDATSLGSMPKRIEYLLEVALLRESGDR